MPTGKETTREMNVREARENMGKNKQFLQDYLDRGPDVEAESYGSLHTGVKNAEKQRECNSHSQDQNEYEDVQHDNGDDDTYGNRDDGQYHNEDDGGGHYGDRNDGQYGNRYDGDQYGNRDVPGDSKYFKEEISIDFKYTHMIRSYNL